MATIVLHAAEHQTWEPGDDGRVEPATVTSLLLKPREAAALCNTSLRTWWAWDAAGKIPQAIRIGRSVFWRPETLRAWVDAGCPDRQTWEAIE